MIKQHLPTQRAYLQNPMKQAAIIESNKAALSYRKADLISSLEVGTVVSGKIGTDAHGQMKLQIAHQLELPITLNEPTQMNKLLDFIILANEKGLLHLKVVPEQQQQSFKDKVLEELRLPKDEVMSKCIEQFIEDDAPLDKAQLLKTYHLANTFNLPIKVVMDLGNKLGISANQFFMTLEKGMTLPPYEQSKNLEYILFEDEALTQSQKLQNAIKLFEEDILRDSSIDGLHQNTNQVENLSKKEWLKVGNDADLVRYLKQQGAEGLDRDQIDLEEWIASVKKKFGEAFEMSSKTDLTKSSSKEELKLYNCTEKLLTVLERLDEFQLSEQGSKQGEELKESAQVWHKLNQEGEYYQYPLFLNGKKQEAEIYFFKPNKKTSTNKKDFYAVLALDFPTIKHIDIHIHQVEQAIDILIEVEDEAISKVFNQYSSQLLSKVSDKGYHLQKYTCRVKRLEVDCEKVLHKEKIEGINVTI